MKFEINKLNIKAGKLYRGWIMGHRIEQQKLYIYVDLDEFPGTRFLKVVPIDSNPQSTFCRISENLNILDDEGYIETDYLKEIAIVANLKKANNSVWYINRLERDMTYYQQTEDEDDDDVEDEYIYYGDEE